MKKNLILFLNENTYLEVIQHKNTMRIMERFSTEPDLTPRNTADCKKNINSINFQNSQFRSILSYQTNK